MEDAGLQLCTKWPAHKDCLRIVVTQKMEQTIQYLRFHLPAKMSGFPIRVELNAH